MSEHFPGYTGNAASQRQHISLLPSVNQTTALARFFGSTVDPVFQTGSFDALDAYVGRYPSYYNSTQDFYLGEPTEARTNYQLEPAMISLDPAGTLADALTYPDLLGYLQGQGAVMGQDSRMFETDAYCWAPPVDLDKLTNYHQYFWFGDYTGGTALPVLTLTAPTLAFIGDASTASFALPAALPQIGGARETIAVYVNSVKVSGIVINGGTVTLPLAPEFGDQVVTTRYDDLSVALTGAPVGAPIGALLGAPPGDAVVQMSLVGLVDPALPYANSLTSGMRIDLQDTLRIFNAWSSEAPGDAAQTYTQDWDEPYLAIPPQAGQPPHDQALWDGAPTGRFLVDGVGQSIRLTPDDRLNRALAPQYVTIDRSSVDQNPWSLTNSWHHKDSFAWSGLHFAGRVAQRPIVEFIRDLTLYQYGRQRAAPVDGVLSSDTALLRQPDQSQSAIPLAAIAGQPMGAVSVDAGVVLFPGMRLLVAQKTQPAQQLYQVDSSGGAITLTPLPMTPNDVLRIIRASGYGPPNSEVWFNGTLWAKAQPWQESAGEAIDPLFHLYDLNGVALDDPFYANSTFAGSRIFGYALGSGRRDSVLHRPLQYDNNGAIRFENDVVTRRAATILNGVATAISGLYCYQTIGADRPVSLWHQTAQPTTQSVFTTDRAGIRYFNVPLNLAANPGSLDVTVLSRSDWVLHFGNEIANQIGFDAYRSPTGTLASAYADNNWRDSARDLSLGTEVLQHVAPLLKLMLLASTPAVDYFAAVRFVAGEYHLFRHKFARKLVEIDRKGGFPSTITDAGQSAPMTLAQIATSLDLVLTNLKVDRSADFPFALSTMAGTLTDQQFFIPATPAFLGLLPACRPGLMLDDVTPQPGGAGVLMIRGHDGSLTPAYGDWRDALMVALEQQIYDSIPHALTLAERPLCDLAFYCAGRFCPAATGAFATTDTAYTGVSYRRGEIQAMLAPLFERWALTAQQDYRSHTGFVVDDPFTWNYHGVLDRYGAALPGHWTAIYRWYFDTERPHCAPWEMLGFADPPSWWVGVYGPAPYTSANTGLWADLEAGTIRQGPRAGFNLRYARPGLSHVIPVDAVGMLRDPLASGIVPVGPGSILASRDWVNGDGGPVEQVWINSPAYRYALAEIGFLAKPARWVEIGWDRINTGFSSFGDQWIDLRTQQRPLTAATLVHGETFFDSQGLQQTTVIVGLQQWLVDYLRASAKPASLLGDAVRGLDVRLLHQMAGFVTPDNLTVVTDNFGVVPREDTNIMLYTAPSSGTEVYSGVVLEYTGSGPHHAGPGWRVVGYDARDPHFHLIPPDTTGPQNILSLATPPDPVIVEWHANTYFRQDVFCAYQGYTYRALASHLSGPVFELKFWIYDATAASLAPRVVHYLNGLHDGSGNPILDSLAYGTILLSLQAVADFLWSYERFLRSRGWRFVAPDANGAPQTWTEAVREFLIWSQVRWTVGNFIALSPGATVLHFTAPVGMVLNVETNDTGYYGLLDRSGGPILPQRVHLSRLGSDLTLQADAADMFAARVRIVTVEHALVFDNTTIFNDVIYQPLFNMRQARLKLLLNRTTHWAGRLDAPGFIVTGASLLPSFDRTVEDIRLMFDIEQSKRQDITDFARHNINYQARDYLGNLLLSEIQQFEFTQGMAQQKGAPGVFQKLLRSARVSANSNIVFLEEFALRQPARFGGPAAPRIGFRLAQSSDRREPQFIRLSNDPALDPTWITLPAGDPRWLDPPSAATPFFPTLAEPDPAAPLSDMLAKRLPDAGPVRLDEASYTVFHVADLAPLYRSAVAGGLTPFTTGQTIWLYDAPATRSWDMLGVFDLGTAENPLSRSLTVTEDPAVNGVRLVFSQPHGLTSADQGGWLVVAGPAYSVPEIDGIQTITLVNAAENWIEIDTAGSTGYDFTLTANQTAHPQRSPPVVRALHSLRFASQPALLASPLLWSTGTLAWIDHDTTQGGWSVYQRLDPSAGSFALYRCQPPRLDPSQIALATVYDSATKITADRRIIVDEPILADLVIVDPLAGFLPGVAMREITVQSEFDPAKYTSSRLFGRVTDAWGAPEIGRVWWDISTVRYLDPYTDRIGASPARDLAEINYRISAWAQIAPATSVDVYEWVQSDVTPDQYTLLAQTDTTGTYRGTVYQPDAPPFAQAAQYSPAFGRDLTMYYFWVTGLTTVPNVPRRTISIQQIGTILQSPTAQDIPWFAPILPDGMLVAGLMPYLNDTSTVLQVRRHTGTADPGHQQWQLLRPNDPRSLPPDWLWRGLSDSLAGFDAALHPVPDPALPVRRAVGVQQGQSLFRQERDQPGDRLGLCDARESFVGIVNQILAATPVTQDRPAGVAVLDRETPIAADLLWTRRDHGQIIEPPPATEWDDTVPSFAARNRLLLRPDFYAAPANGAIRRVLVDGTTLAQPQWSIWWFQPSIAANLLAANAASRTPLASIDVLVNHADTVFTLAPAYERAVPDWATRNTLLTLPVGTRVLVSADESVDAAHPLWVIYRYDPAQPVADRYGFVVHRVQTYRTSDFYRAVDWFQQGFNDGAQTRNFSAGHPPLVSYPSMLARDITEGTAALHAQNGTAPANLFVQILSPVPDSPFIWQYYVDYRDASNAVVRGWVTVARQRGTIALSANFYNPALPVHAVGSLATTTWPNRDGSWEIKVLAQALRSGGLLLDLEINQVLFSLLHFIHAQQDVVDWVFKSSFMVIAGYAIPLLQTGIQQADVTDSLISYVNEVKPYHVKIRDYTAQYVPATELVTVRVTDFDHTAYYDIQVTAATSQVPRRRLNPLSNTDMAQIAALDGSPAANLAVLDWTAWGAYQAVPVVENAVTVVAFNPPMTQNAAGWWANPVRHITTTLRFDRVSDESSLLTWDGVSANAATVAWDATGWDISEIGTDTAAGRILADYLPRDGMPPFDTMGTLINTLFRFPSVPLSGNTMANAAADNIVAVDATANSANSLAVSINPTLPSGFDPGYGHVDAATRAPSALFVDPDHPEERVAARLDDSVRLTVTAQGAPGAPGQAVRVYDVYPPVAQPVLRYAPGAYAAQARTGVLVYFDGVRVTDGVDYTVDTFAQTISLLTAPPDHRVSVRSFGFAGQGGIVEQRRLRYDPAHPIIPLTRAPDANFVQVLIEGVLQDASRFSLGQIGLGQIGLDVHVVAAGANLAIVVWDRPVDTCCLVQTQTLDLTAAIALTAPAGFSQFALTNPDRETQPLHAGTMVELDGRRLTPPLTYYGAITPAQRFLGVDFDVSPTTPIDLLIEGVITPAVPVPRWDAVATDGSVTGYPFNLIAAGPPSGPGRFVLFGRILVATDPAFTCADFGAVFYETQNALGAVMDYQIVHSGSSYALQIATALLAGAAAVLVTTFTQAGLMAIRTQTSFAAINGEYPVPTPFSAQYSMVSFDGLMLAPEVDYDFASVREGFDESVFGTPFGAQYDATILTVPRAPALSANLDRMQPVIITLFNGTPARLPTIWRQATATPAQGRMLQAHGGGWDEAAYDDFYTVYDQPEAWQFGYPRYPGANPAPVQVYDMAKTWTFNRQDRPASGILLTPLQPDDLTVSIRLDGLANVAPSLWPIWPETLDNGVSYHWAGQVFGLPDSAENRPGAVWIGSERVEYLSLDTQPAPSGPFTVATLSAVPPTVVLGDLRRGTQGTSAVQENRVHHVFIANGLTQDFKLDTAGRVDLQIRLGTANTVAWAGYSRAMTAAGANVTSTLYPVLQTRFADADVATWAQFGQNGVNNPHNVLSTSPRIERYWPSLGRDYTLMGLAGVSLLVAPPTGAWVILGVTVDQAHPADTVVMDAMTVFQPPQFVRDADRLDDPRGVVP